MTDEAYVFNETNRERAIIRQSARYKKNGSKSKKCTLEVDRMTAKQIEKQHGEIVSCKMSDFYTYEEFRKFPKDIQVEYINYLIGKYGIGIGTIGNHLFHLTHGVLYMHLQRNNLLSMIRKIARGYVCKDNIERFKNDISTFYGKVEEVEAPEKKSEPIEEVKSQDPLDILCPKVAMKPTATTETMHFSTGYICTGVDFSPVFGIDYLFKGKTVRITIDIELA